MATATSQTELTQQVSELSSRPRRLTWLAMIDGAERVLLLGLYAFFVWRLLPRGDGSAWLITTLLLFSEGLVLVLFLIRRPTLAISTRRTDWLLALGGAFLPLLVARSATTGSLAPPMVCLYVMICGILLQVHAKLSLGRSMGLVAANRGIKRSGPYQLIRHPMYAGYVLTHAAFWLFNPNGWNLVVYSCAFGVQVFRLLAEERYLAQSAEYREYMQSVRYRLIPGVI